MVPSSTTVAELFGTVVLDLGATVEEEDGGTVPWEDKPSDELDKPAIWLLLNTSPELEDCRRFDAELKRSTDAEDNWFKALLMESNIA
jgi:hypothetical protein